MHVQLALIKGSRRQRFTITKSETIIGRQKGCDLRIPMSEISRRHCVLRVAGDEVTVEDLDSINGTFLNEDRVHGVMEVLSGDQIRLGPIIFVAELDLAGVHGDDGERIPRARPIFDEGDIEEDVEVVDDGMPAPAAPVGEEPRDEVTLPIPVESSEALPAVDDEKTKPRKKRPAPPKPAEEQLPLPAASGDELMQQFAMPPDSDFSALLDGIMESEKDKQREKPE